MDRIVRKLTAPPESPSSQRWLTQKIAKVRHSTSANPIDYVVSVYQTDNIYLLDLLGVHYAPCLLGVVVVEQEVPHAVKKEKMRLALEQQKIVRVNMWVSLFALPKQCSNAR